eukprot:7067571-Prymnesium_polylepis.1
MSMADTDTRAALGELGVEGKAPPENKVTDVSSKARGAGGRRGSVTLAQGVGTIQSARRRSMSGMSVSEQQKLAGTEVGSAERPDPLGGGIPE